VVFEANTYDSSSNADRQPCFEGVIKWQTHIWFALEISHFYLHWLDADCSGARDAGE
jgi:hypothetical protein